MTTSEACLREAFAALLEGDTWKRDKMCESARILMTYERRDAAVARVLAVDFYVTGKGTVVPTRLMAAQAGVI